MPPRAKAALQDWTKQLGIPAVTVITAILAIAWSDHNVLVDTKAQVQNLNRVADDIRAAAHEFQDKIELYLRRIDANTVALLELEADVKVLDAKVNGHLQKQ